MDAVFDPVGPGPKAIPVTEIHQSYLEKKSRWCNMTISVLDLSIAHVWDSWLGCILSADCEEVSGIQRIRQKSLELTYIHMENQS